MDAENNGLDQKLFDYLQKSIKETEYYKLLDIQLQLLAPGYAEIRVVAGPQHTNPLGLIHGGLITSIVDAAMGNAIRSLGLTGVTVDLSVGLTAGARVGDTIVARGKVLKSGKSMIFTEATVYCGDTMLAYSKATFYKICDINY